MSKRIGLLVVLFFTVVAFMSAQEAQEAVFSEINGKVEYQLAGGDWRPARLGDKVGKGSMVSTGFKSNAVLKFETISIALKPITRLSLEELLKTQGGTQTQLFLLAGRVKADVPPQPGQTADFRVKSPTATASVRGTAFEFDGLNLIVDRGTVQLRNERGGQTRQVRQGEFSYVAPDGSVPSPAAVPTDQGLENVEELVDQTGESNLAPPPVETPTPTPTPPDNTPVVPPAALPGELIITLQ